MKPWSKLRSLVRRRKLDADMSDEIRLHLEFQTERNIAAGMDPDEARYAAQRTFGGVEQVKERCREQRAWVGLELLTKDVRFAFRVLTRRRGLTAVILATLAICLGANSALFSLVRATLLEPYPYPDPDRVVNLGMVWLKMQWKDMVQEISPRTFLDLEQSATSFDSLGFIEGGAETDLHWRGRTLRVRSAKVTPGLWMTARVPAKLGRTFTDDDVASAGSGMVVLSHDLWRTAFDGAANVIGTKVRLDDEVSEIVGVMPRGFSVTDNRVQLWRPKVFSAWERSEQARGVHAFQAIARLRDGVSLPQAQQEMEALHRAYVEQHPEARTANEQLGETYGAVPLAGWVRERAAGSMFVAVQAAAGLVLLLGCLNIAGLVAVHAHRRLGELALRHAFGATRWRLARQLGIETLTLFALGGVLAALTGGVGVQFLRAHYDLAQTTPFGQPADFGGWMVGLTVAAAVGAGLLVGLVPALFAARRNLSGAIQSIGTRPTDGRRQRRTQSVFVVAQIALAVVLLAAALVTARNLRALLQRGFGVAVEDRIVAKVSLPGYRYGGGADATAARINPFKERAVLALENLPGVRSVTVANRLPLSADQAMKSGFGVPGYTPAPGDPWPIAFTYQIRPGFFRTIGITLLRGRDMAASDAPEGEPVAIISEEIARRYYATTDPVGAQIYAQGRACRIIGVAREVRSVPLNFGDAPAIYLSAAQWPALAEDCVFVIQGAAGGGELAASATKTLLALDPALAVRTTSMVEVLDRAVLTQSVPMEVAGFFAVLSVALMALGIYGMLANVVVQRTRELGVRVALGAQRGSIFAMILGWGGRLAAIGVGLGGLMTLPLLAWLEPLMVSSDATGSVVIVAAGVLVLLVTLGASWWPARAAMKVDPIVALRCE